MGRNGSSEDIILLKVFISLLINMEEFIFGTIKENEPIIAASL